MDARFHTVFRQLQPPTGVEHGAFARLTGADEPNLVVAKTSVLEVYDVVRSDLGLRWNRDDDGDDDQDDVLGLDDDATGGVGAGAGGMGAATQRRRRRGFRFVGGGEDARGEGWLSLAGSFQLFGHVHSVAVVRLRDDAVVTTGPGGVPVPPDACRGRDLVMLSFSDAKISVVGWDPLRRQLVTVAMANLEDGALGIGSAVRAESRGLKELTGLSSTPTVIVDPSQACAALLVYGDQVAILPFRHAVSGVDDDLDDLDDLYAEHPGDDPSAAAAAHKRLKTALFGGSSNTRNGHPSSGVPGDDGGDEEDNDVDDDDDDDEDDDEDDDDGDDDDEDDNDDDGHHHGQDGSSGHDEGVRTGVDGTKPRKSKKKRKRVRGGLTSGVAPPAIRRPGGSGGAGNVGATGEGDHAGGSASRPAGGDAGALASASAGAGAGVGATTNTSGDMLREPYVFPLSAVKSASADESDRGITGNVLGMSFLRGYFQPTLVFLHARDPPAAARFAVQKHCCRLAAVSLDIAARTNPVIWSFDNLPFDCANVFPVPEPFGGVIVTSVNAVMYFNQHQFCGLATTGFASSVVDTDSYPLSENPVPLCLTMDLARITFARPDSAVVSMPSGDLYVLQLIAPSSVVESLVMAPLGITTAVSTCLAVDPDSKYLFQGSRVGSSILYRLKQGKRKDGTGTHARSGLEAAGMVGAGASGAGAGAGAGAGSGAGAGAGAAVSGAGAGAGGSSTLLPAPSEPIIAPDGLGDDPDAEDEWMYGRSLTAAKVASSGASGTGGQHTHNGGSTTGPASGATAEAGVWKAGDGDGDDDDDDDDDDGVDGAGLLALAEAGLPAVVRTGIVQGALDVLPTDGSVGDAVLALGAKSVLDRQLFPMAPQSPELVVTTGYGLDGGLAVISRSLRPSVVTHLPIHNVTGSWAVQHVQSASRAPALPQESLFHRFVFFSIKNESTRVFERRDEQMNEVTARSDAEFVFDQATVGAGSVFGGRRIVQVHDTGVRVLDGASNEQDISINLPLELSGLGAPGCSVVSCAVLDPYVILRLSDGSMRLLTADPTDMDFVVSDPFSGASLRAEASHGTDVAIDLTPISSVSMFRADAATDRAITGRLPNLQALGVYAVVSRVGGSLQFYRLPDFQVVFECPVATFGPPMMMDRHTAAEVGVVGADDPVGAPTLSAPGAGAAADGSSTGMPTPGGSMKRSASLISPSAAQTPRSAATSDPLTPAPAGGRFSSAAGGSSRHSAPRVYIIDSLFQYMPQPVLMLTLSNGDLLVYEAHPWRPYESALPAPASTFRFCRVSHDLPTRLTPNQLRSATPPLRSLIPFDDIGGWRGGAFLGSSPAIVVSRRGSVRVVMLSPVTLRPQPSGKLPLLCTPFPIRSLAPFHSDVQDRGVILVQEDGILFAEFPPASSVVLHGSIPMRRIPLDCTAHKVTYLQAGSSSGVPLFAVGVSTEVPVDKEADEAAHAKLLEEEGEEYDQQVLHHGEHEELLTPDELGEPEIPMLACEVRLYQGGSWSHEASYPLGLGERVLALKEVSLPNQRGILEPLIAVGTGIVHARGEDAAGDGRLLLLRKEATQEKTYRFSTVVASDVKGVVTAIGMLNLKSRYLVAAVGVKVMVYAWREDRGKHDIRIAAFFTAPHVVTDLHIVRNFILFSDMYKSLHFLMLSEDDVGCDLVLLGKDYSPLMSTCSQMLNNGPSLALTVADEHKNLQMFTFRPAEKLGVTAPLHRAADFHVGSVVTRMLRPIMNATTEGMIRNKSCLLFGTADGSLCSVVPVDEVVFKRLVSLQKLMTYALPHVAGLNPKAYRLFSAPECRHFGRSKNVIDGALVFQFLSLDRRLQRDLCRALGTTHDRVVSSLRELELSMAVF